MIQIIPAILATTEEEYKQKLQKIEGSSAFAEGWVQIDFMDNKFVQNQSIAADVVKKYPTPLKVEAHLMVEEALSWVEELLPVADRFILPVEVIDKNQPVLKLARDNHKQVGLAVNPETPIEKLTDYLQGLDSVIVMSVKPGFGGQQFMPEVLEKAKQIKQKQPDLLVGMDGGINPDNIKQVAEAGVDYVAIGSGIIEGDIDENLEKFWEALS